MGLTISDGYVVYQRGAKSKSPYWKHIHNKALEDASSIQSLYDRQADKGRIAGERLLALGQAEQVKELSLINQATGSTYTSALDIKMFIQNFNEVLVGKQQFMAIQSRLKSALTKPNQSIGNRAPTIASWFTNALGTALNRNINNFITNNLDALIAKQFTIWEQQFDAIIDKSIDDALKQLLTKMDEKSGKELYGDQESWRQIYDAAQQLQGFNQYFQQMIRSKFDFNQIRNILQNETVKITNKSHRGIRKVIDSKQGLNLRNERKSRAVGGSVQEFIENISTMIGQAAQTAASSGGRVASSEMMKTDNFTIFSYEETFDGEGVAQQLANALNDTMMTSGTLQEAVSLMDGFWNEHLSKLHNSFIVYGSTKAYALTASFGGFHGGGSRNLEDAKSIIAQAGFDLNTVSRFINAAYNTGDGAIFASQRGEYSEELEQALSSAVANLLFDDWATIGEYTGGAQAIHVLQLDTLQVPLSVFLIAAGRALIDASQDTQRFIQIHLNLPGEIKYKEPIQTEGGHMSEIVEKWNEQAEIAKNESSFSLVFLKNFKQMITEWISF